MHNPKHKLFSIRISEKKKIEFDQVAFDMINDFLSESNNVYINHSITVLSSPIIDYQRIVSYNHHIIVSLIYKDLNETELDLSKTSKKTKEIVKKSIALGEKIPMPNIETDFEKNARNRNVKS